MSKIRRYDGEVVVQETGIEKWNVEVSPIPGEPAVGREEDFREVSEEFLLLLEDVSGVVVEGEDLGLPPTYFLPART